MVNKSFTGMVTTLVISYQSNQRKCVEKYNNINYVQLDKMIHYLGQ